jgi:hypothetical protein
MGSSVSPVNIRELRKKCKLRHLRLFCIGLSLKRYGDKALEQSRTRVDELAADGDHDGADTWRRITIAVEQLATTTPPGPLH